MSIELQERGKSLSLERLEDLGETFRLFILNWYQMGFKGM
jgi:hypothetical protein